MVEKTSSFMIFSPCEVHWWIAFINRTCEHLSLSFSLSHTHSTHINTISMSRYTILELRQSQFVNLEPSTKTIPLFFSAIISLIFAVKHPKRLCKIYACVQRNFNYFLTTRICLNYLEFMFTYVYFIFSCSTTVPKGSQAR